MRRATRQYRAALEQYDVRRDALGYRDPVLPAESGKVHAVSGAPLRRGDAPEFKVYPWGAACGYPVRVILPVTFDDADPDACTACAEAIAKGRPARHFAEWQCLSTVIPTLPGFSQVVECQLTSGHQGRHRGEGATWTDGADFAPSDYTVGDVEDL